MRITIFGSGYVGLVTGACLADAGNHVVCVDVDQRKIDLLKQGGMPIHEPGLDAVVKRNFDAGRLRFTSSAEEGVRHGLFQLIAVGTPPDEDGSADLRYVLAVARSIGEHMTEYKVVITKSTVPVGTADKVRQAVSESLAARQAVVEFDTVSNPEFLKEGAAIDDFQRPDRIVIGAFSERARGVVAELYAPFVRTESPIYFMDPASAELTKYAANAMLATRISFINEVANLCERVGADVDAVRKALGADKRIGHPFLFPGVGYGGSCFPKDVKALVATARNQGLDFALLAAVDAVNDRQKRLLAQKARAYFAGQGGMRGRKLAVWGLAFKPKTDDIRAAPALALIEELLADGAVVAVHDPVALEPSRRQLGDRVQYAANPYAAVQDAEALFLMTEWNEFRQPDFARVKELMAKPVVFDGRNIWNPQRLAELGFTYHGVGRRAASEPR